MERFKKEVITSNIRKLTYHAGEFVKSSGLNSVGNKSELVIALDQFLLRSDVIFPATVAAGAFAVGLMTMSELTEGMDDWGVGVRVGKKIDAFQKGASAGVVVAIPIAAILIK